MVWYFHDGCIMTLDPYCAACAERDEQDSKEARKSLGWEARPVPSYHPGTHLVDRAITLLEEPLLDMDAWGVCEKLNIG